MEFIPSSRESITWLVGHAMYGENSLIRSNCTSVANKIMQDIGRLSCVCIPRSDDIDKQFTGLTLKDNQIGFFT